MMLHQWSTSVGQGRKGRPITAAQLQLHCAACRTLNWLLAGQASTDVCADDSNGKLSAASSKSVSFLCIIAAADS
jgi:hypothetical protein